MLADKPNELSRIKLKTWTRQPVPMISEHSAHLTPLTASCQHVRFTPLKLRLKTPIFYKSQEYIIYNTYTHTHIHAWMHACMDACMHAYIHTYIHTDIFVVVNFDALAQASDIQIERRQVVFLCWMQDLNPGSQIPNRKKAECSLTYRLSYRGSS